jgi:hypothetical protein
VLTPKLIEAFKEVQKIGMGYIVGEKAKSDLRTARGVVHAREFGLEVEWHHDDMFEVGDQGDWISDADWIKGQNEGRYDVLIGMVKDHKGHTLAALGGVTVDYWVKQYSWKDYIKGFELELLAEAQEALKKDTY